jgi:teichuronic acid biosynthesis glycosyltransferase TuaH
MIVNRDIIIVGQQRWDTELGSNCKSIAIELSKNNRVLYVDSPLDRITWLRGFKDPKIKKRVSIIRGTYQSLNKNEKNLWNYQPDCMVESINWINSHFLFNFLNKLNNRKFARSIKKALTVLGFTDYILFNDHEIFKAYYLKELLKPSLTIYYCRDYIVGVSYWKKHGLRLEAELLKKSDLCVSNSEYLTEYCKSYNPMSFNVGQGCDVDVFLEGTSQQPKDLAKISAPTIGYAGVLYSIRLDIAVLEYIALSFPDYRIVLVGPEDDEFKRSNLHKFDNVLFLGQKPYELLPAYIDSFDICLNPQLINEITIGNYPRKIDEYLALGKAVVATKTKTMEAFRDCTYLATTKEEYVSLIRRALSEDSPQLKEKRREIASTHTWENSVKKIYDAINLTFTK